MRKLVMGCAVAAFVVLSAQSVARTPASVRNLGPVVPKKKDVVGVASWYGEECQGNLTASGEIFDMNALTAAHWDYPFGTKLKVTNIRNDRSIVVRVNDRGPGIEGRFIDVSMGAAEKLGFLNAGLTDVRVEVVSQPEERVAEAGGMSNPAPRAGGK